MSKCILVVEDQADNRRILRDLLASRLGFEGRFEYSAIGTVVNLAARLCAQAEAGQILIDPKVHSAVEPLAEFEPAGELTLKGLSRPIKAFKVGDLRAT